MQKQKGIFPPQRDHARGVTTLIGIIIIVAVALILFGGVFAYQYFLESNPPTGQTTNDFEIKELGLKFKITADIKDLKYLIKDSGAYGKDVLFSTKSLALEDKNCDVSESPLGFVNVGSVRHAEEAGLKMILSSNSLYIYYASPQDVCSTKKSAYNLQSKQIQSFKNALKTITTTGAPTTQTAGWKTYTNNEYGFEFKYPASGNMKIVPPGDVVKATIILPIAEEGMHTNIDAKNLYINIKQNNNDSVCVGQNYYSQTSNILINGIQFSKGGGGEGAAGHSYVYTDYTTSKNNACITMSFIISSYNDLQIPAYNGGEPFTQYDFSKEEPLFSQIISTFKFTK